MQQRWCVVHWFLEVHCIAYTAKINVLIGFKFFSKRSLLRDPLTGLIMWLADNTSPAVACCYALLLTCFKQSMKQAAGMVALQGKLLPGSNIDTEKLPRLSSGITELLTLPQICTKTNVERTAKIKEFTHYRTKTCSPVGRKKEFQSYSTNNTRRKISKGGNWTDFMQLSLWWKPEKQKMHDHPCTSSLRLATPASAWRRFLHPFILAQKPLIQSRLLDAVKTKTVRQSCPHTASRPYTLHAPQVQRLQWGLPKTSLVTRSKAALLKSLECLVLQFK